ncbi:MAG: tetratricopeptide repeat protein, partial [Pseudomonadota bacterium]
EEAEALLDKTLAETPDNIQAIGLKGNIQLSRGDQDGAMALYQKVLEFDPDNGAARSAIARIHQRRGDQAAAETTLEEGLEANPDNVYLKTRLAQFRELQGRFDEAIVLYREVYAVSPNSLLVANNLASLLAEHRADDPAALEFAYQMAGRLREASLPHYRDTYAWTRYLKGEFTEAEEYLASAVEQLGSNAYVHYHYGMTLLKLEKTDLGAEHLQKALEAADDTFTKQSEIEDTLRAIGKI